MSASPISVAALRSLLAARFPEKVRRVTGVVPTGVSQIDDALGGGLPAGLLTELVSTAPGTGGQTIIAQLLTTTRAARQRVALIDGADGFAANEVPPDALRHLVWVRARDPAKAFAAADILARDGNYAVVLFDLRGLSERALLKMPSALWHRLRHAVADSPTAFLVQTTTPLVPVVPWRLVLSGVKPLASRRTLRSKLTQTFHVEITRSRADAEEMTA